MRRVHKMVAVQSNLIPPGDVALPQFVLFRGSLSLLLLPLRCPFALLFVKAHPLEIVSGTLANLKMLQVVTNHGSACLDLDACLLSQH